MKVKSSGTVAPKQQSLRQSNPFAVRPRSPGPSQKEKKAGHLRPAFPSKIPAAVKPAEINDRRAPSIRHCSWGPTTPPAPRRRWCRGTANSHGRGGALCLAVRTPLRTEPSTKQSALTRQSSKWSSAFSSPLTQSRCETTCLACLAAFKGDRDRRRRLLLGPTSRCGEQILCSNLFSTRYWSSNLLVDFKRRQHRSRYLVVVHPRRKSDRSTGRLRNIHPASMDIARPEG